MWKLLNNFSTKESKIFLYRAKFMMEGQNQRENRSKASN